MKGAGGFETPGARTERTDFRSHGNPARRFGYPVGWVRHDPRDRDPRDEIIDRLERIEGLLSDLLRERLP